MHILRTKVWTFCIAPAFPKNDINSNDYWTGHHYNRQEKMYKIIWKMLHWYKLYEWRKFMTNCYNKSKNISLTALNRNKLSSRIFLFTSLDIQFVLVLFRIWTTFPIAPRTGRCIVLYNSYVLGFKMDSDIE